MVKPKDSWDLIEGPKLMQMKLPDTPWIVPGLLPQGLTVLVGKRKEGKSWLALGLAVAVSEDDELFERYEVNAGSALYIAYEDTKKRVQTRLGRLTSTVDRKISLVTTAPRAPALFDKLQQWVDGEPNPRLIVIDILTMAWPIGERMTTYERTYTILSEQFQGFAHKHNLAIVVVHHPTKGKNPDPLDAIRGSGIAEAADTIWFLKRDPVEPHADLYVKGRDLEDEAMIAIEFDRGKWKAVDNINPKQQAIKMVIVAAGANGLTPKEVFDRLAKGPHPLDYAYVRVTMNRMQKKGKLIKDKNGRYREP